MYKTRRGRITLVKGREIVLEQRLDTQALSVGDLLSVGIGANNSVTGVLCPNQNTKGRSTSLLCAVWDAAS
jgi:hypothetical protein